MFLPHMKSSKERAVHRTKGAVNIDRLLYGAQVITAPDARRSPTVQNPPSPALTNHLLM